MDARGRFRVLSNLAASFLGEAQYEKAAGLFLEAKLLQPNDERACANEAMAYQLLGKPERAFEVASQHRNMFPSSAKVAAVWAQNAPQNMVFKDLEHQLPDHLMNDGEVAFSLAMRAANEGAFEAAELLAKKEIEVIPEWAYPWLLLAKVITKKHLAKEMVEQGKLGTDSAATDLNKAEESSEKAVALAKKEGMKGVVAEALMTRGLIRAFLGRGLESEQD